MEQAGSRSGGRFSNSGSRFSRTSSGPGGSRSGPGGGSRSGSGTGSRQGSRTRDNREGGMKFFRKKVCRLCTDRVPAVDFKETDRLLKFLTEKGKILPSRISGNCTPHQRMLARAIKKARHASLIGFQLGV